MDPMKIITYVAITAVVALVALGGIAFYAGYTAGLGGPDNGARASVVGSTRSSETLAEIKSLNREIAELKQSLAERKEPGSEALAEARAQMARISEELDAAKRELAEAREDAAALRARLDSVQQSADATADATADGAPAAEQRTAALQQGDDAVVLYDRFQLEREASKGYDEVDLRFGLQTVGSRSAGLSVNGKRISMQVKDGKQIIHRGVTCELILLDTDQTVQQAQFSLACKR